jgi:hypothetical protein
MAKKNKANMAKRVPPDWIKQRTEVTVRGMDGKPTSWYDVYGAFRQGARVRS